MSYVKIAVIGGLVISAPFILTQIWLFISPGLNSKEKKYIIVSLFIGGIFFILGVIFSYIIVLPTMIVFFIGFQIEEIQPMISFSNYLSFVITTLLSFGIIFELPIVMVLLTRFNIVNINFFKKNRKMFILVIFIIAAILTPPDVVSQVLLAIPMLALFEIGIILSSIFEKRKKLKTPS
jgi:sec-independent protein translocase protein TatC